MVTDWRAEQRAKVALRTHAPMSAADRRVAQTVVDRADAQRWVALVWVGAAVVAAVLGLVLKAAWLVGLGVLLLLVGGLWWLLRTRRVLAQGAQIGLVPRRVRVAHASSPRKA